MARARTYSEAIRLLNTCQSNAATIEAIRKSGGRLNEWGIKEMLDYLRRIGYAPDDLNKLNVVHITGTKGKGSTSAFTERILRSQIGGKVGLYTSPHLCAVRERIRVNGEPLSEDDFAKYFFEVWERLEADPKTLTDHTPVFPIYFRLLTLLAFHAFLSMGVDATVLEVGIGGTYDSTNIVPRPVVTGVSALGLDHTAVLGNTIEEIATNKGGIYKAGVPALSVPQEQAAGLAVLRACAEKVGAPFEIVPPLPASVSLGLRGEHQRVNASLAVGLAKRFLQATGRSVDGTDFPEAFKAPLAATRWPGRCQAAKDDKDSNITWLLDGAHTVESLRSCGEWAWAEEATKPTALIFNTSGGRQSEILLAALLDAGAGAAGTDRATLGAGFTDVIFCTNVTYTDGHFKGDLTAAAIDPNDLAALATQRALADAWTKLVPGFSGKVHVVPSIEHAVNIVHEEEGPRSVLVAGSLHLVGGVMEVAGLQNALSME
ncbi:uncharacterized protein CcaverHIS019_0204590 [Cutaneotrichosporon cavernicola]|uniref:Folylpolyglutamate synthase n=1 Tax=Cutaneotrichosporon cavernicola TaxID=279322 RepID=A0AA48I4B4_9TREE|nr:uncharacterized protein CcaverHIS019_0204590 [Cutaneotrichosporon cavernicola]BEI89097.1 hypothetical protein CcaverHIS019_0204590 [Cutaneotrichosporon cavernicola]BEI96873.1 hypothetical protein CcaverHIS631_0204620 [Cutaneotrichosporon cavernicola]BEJ04645.1 hypothetical protein CcaverHIS641_0204620 [Cutaneotrichosporon cavernicola]